MDRKKAEKKIRKQGIEKITSLSELDSLKLVQKLEVYQIELEMQNEELTNAKIIAEETSQKYADLYSEIYDFAPIGYFTFSRDGKISGLNLTGSKLLGIERSVLINNFFSLFLAPDSRLVFNDFLKNIFENKEKAKCELKIEKKNSPPVFAYVEGTLSGKENKCLAMFIDITDRKKTEEALRESAQRLKFHFENSPLAIVEWDMDYVVTRWSREAERLFGWKAEEAVGKQMYSLNLIYPMDIPLVAGTVEKLSGGTERAVISSNRNITKSGDIIECVWYNSVLVNENGKMTSVMSLVNNITELKRAENELRESEEKFKQLANSIPQLAWIARYDGYVTWYNQQWYDYTGTNPEQMEGWGWQIVHDPDLLPDVLKKWKESIATGKPFEMVFPLLGKDGIFREFLTRDIPIKDSKGNIVQWFGTNTDISELKRAEKELRIVQEKLNLALENANIGIWEWDLRTNEMIWDERMEKMFELKPGSFAKSFKSFAGLINEEDISHIQTAVKKSLENDIPFEVMFRTRSENNNSKYISLKGLVNKDNYGRSISITGVSFDITGLREGTERLINKLNEELLRSNKDLQQFAYVASHDLQEPLRMVSSFTQLLAKRYQGKLDQDANDYIKFAVEGSKRMYDMLNGLLAYSRVETKGKDFGNVKVNDVLEKVIQNLKLKIEEKNAKIEIKELPVITADETQLIQLFQNLIGNGIKFNTGTPSIYISSKIDDDNYIFSVRDNGMGIENQYFSRIFQIFQRLHLREEYEGIGIGLAVCKRIVERHGGKIWVESDPGKGSMFIFTIPKNLVG